MDEKTKIIVYIIIGLLIVGLLITTFFPGSLTAWKDIGKSADEKCKVPRGYTEQEWREHMNHHPSIYKDCLT